MAGLAGSGYRCFPSGWCDLSVEHERVRRELEGLVRCYVEGCGDEYWMAVIVAPYGSGKTTLLRHLEGYARGLGAAACRVELSELVDFIVERYGTVHESDLPRVVEEFARERLGDASVYVLLVDEVEESYDLLRGIVTYETSPFRGVAEAIRTRSSRVYLVLALGPSSTLKEAVFGPVAWRSRIYTIPLLPRQTVERMVYEAVKPRSELERTAAGLLANMVWWASKGRIAWARMLVDTVVPRLWEALWRGAGDVEAVLSSEEALGREIVEGVPLFDRQAFREARRSVGGSGLAAVLAALPGPVPLSLVSRVVGGEVVPEPSASVVYARTLVRVEELLGEAQAWVERYSRAKGYPAASVEHAMTALEHAVRAWSLNGMVIYDLQSLRELFSLAADIAREVYADDPHAAHLLEALNPDLLSPPTERSGELYAALRPGVIGRLYPTATSTPLIGCARRAGVGQVVEVVESLSLEELLDYSLRIASEVGLSQIAERMQLKPLLLPVKAAASHAGRLACMMLSGERLLVVLLSPKGEARVPRQLRAAAQLTGSIVVEAGQRLSLFAYSLLYSASVGTSACSLDNLGGVDRRALRLYSDLLRSLVLDSMPREAVPGWVEEARRLGEEYGWVLTAAAMAARSPDARAAARLAEASKLLEAIASKLASALGSNIEAPSPLEPFNAVKRLAGVVPEDVRDGLHGVECEEVKGVPLHLAVLLGLRASPPRLEDREEYRVLVESVERLVRASKDLPRLGPLGELASIADSFARLTRLLAELDGSPVAVLVLWPLGRLSRHLAEAAARAEVLSKLYRLVREAVSKLPESMAGEAWKAVEEDISSRSSLAELEDYLSRAAELVAELAGLAASTGELEEARKRTLSRIDSLLSRLNTQDQAPPVEAETET